MVNWTAVTSGITALTAVGALVFTALSLNTTRDQVTVAEQGQFTDRYSRAVEQLAKQGPDQLQIRLGGIYALERLAHDSPRDHPTIVDVLATFVRTNAGKTPPPEFVCPTPGVPESPRADIQAALTVLGRRDHAHDNDTVVDLSDTCLSGLDLSDAKLANANLVDADLVETKLHNADLSGADLDGANLSAATLNNAKLTDADLAGAYLNHAKLVRADLGGADLSGSELFEADLSDAIHTTATSITDVQSDDTTKGAWW